MIQIKNINEKSEHKDGYRILIEYRLPKEALVDLHLKEIAPDKYYEDFDLFKKQYRDKLKKKKTIINIIRNIEKEKETITLLHCSNDNDKNCATILKEKIDGYKTIKSNVSRIHGE